MVSGGFVKNWCAREKDGFLLSSSCFWWSGDCGAVVVESEVSKSGTAWMSPGATGFGLLVSMLYPYR